MLAAARWSTYPPAGEVSVQPDAQRITGEAEHPIKVVYCNYRNETTVRTIVPHRIWFGSTAWHPEPQWLLDALDLEKNEVRSFAVRDIRAWFS